jgi:hypothetical protein
MLAEMLIGGGALAIGGFGYAKSGRARLYRRLAERVARISQTNQFDLSPLASRSLPRFTDRMVVLPDLLPAAAFARLTEEARWLAAPERSYVPTHKQGGTLAYETLIESAPAIVALYHSPGLRSLVARLTGAAVVPTPINDQSSLSLLVYDKPGDHIGWHYDHNFYRGRHFTVLLTLENTGSAADGLSHSVLEARLNAGEVAIASHPNTLVVFEGASVRHRATQIQAGERRVILSMTYCADPRAAWWQGGARRIKDTAYFGLRALWT